MQVENEKTPTLKATVIERLHARGMTIAGWCRVHEFNYQSVKHFLAGRWGSRAAGNGPHRAGKVSACIYKQLLKDKLI
jgi:hypothetical protein